MREIARSSSFERDLKKLAKKHQGIEDDAEACLEDCARNGPPDRAMRIPNQRGRPVFKQRLRLGGKGTRSGARIIYYCDADRVIALALYSKGDRTDIPGEEIRKALESAGLIQARQTEAANG